MTRHPEVSARSPLAGWYGHTINVWDCGGMSMVVLQLKDLLQLFVKREELFSFSRFLSCRDMT